MLALGTLLALLVWYASAPIRRAVEGFRNGWQGKGRL